MKIKISTLNHLTMLMVFSLLTVLLPLSMKAQSAGALFQPGPNMMRAKLYPTATLLDNGKVISFSGREVGFVSCMYSDLYDSSSNTFTEMAMNFPHDASSTVKLADGRFFLLGGGGNSGIAPGYATTEMYDPSTNSFTPKSDMTMARMQQAGIQLNNGQVLIAGAWYNTTGAAVGELYDISTNTFTATGGLNTPRAQTNLFPTADGGAIMTGGWPSYGGAILPSVEYYSPVTNTFTLQSNELIPTDAGWLPLPIFTRPFADCKMNNGKYLMMVYRNITTLEYALVEFDPATKLFSKINTSQPLVDSLTDGGFNDFVLNKADNLVYMIGNDSGFDPSRLCVVTVDLNNGNVYYPSTGHTMPAAEYFYAAYTFLPSSGKILVMGVNSTNSSYFTGTEKTYLLTPEVTVGIRENQNRPIDVLCYPNPANDKFTVKFNNTSGNVNYSINVTDLLGRVVISENKTANQGQVNWEFNTAGLNPGAFVVSIVNGTLEFHQNLLIQR